MGHARYACPPISSVLGGKREFVRRAREEKKYLDPLSLVWKFGLSVVAGPTTFHRRRERFAFRTFYSIGNVSLLGKTSLAAQLQLNPVLRNNYSEERDTLKYSFPWTPVPSFSLSSRFSLRIQCGMRKLFDGHVTLWAIPFPPLLTPHVQLHFMSEFISL